jgi:hypothetical protein
MKTDVKKNWRKIPPQAGAAGPKGEEKKTTRSKQRKNRKDNKPAVTHPGIFSRILRKFENKNKTIACDSV